MLNPYEYCPPEPTVEERLEQVETLLDAVWGYLRESQNLVQCVNCAQIGPRKDMCLVGCSNHSCAHCLHLVMAKQFAERYDQAEDRKAIAEWLVLRGGRRVLERSYVPSLYETMWQHISGMIAPEIEAASKRVR